MRAEVRPALLHRDDPAGVRAGVGAAHRAEPRHRVRPSRSGHLQVPVRPEGGEHAAGEAGIRGQGGVGGEVVARVVGGGQHLDAEPLEQRPGPVGVLGEPLGDLVVDRVRGLCRRPDGDVEDLGELRLEPVPRRRTAEQGPVLAQPAPHLAGLRLGELAAAHAEVVQRDAAGVQEAGDVVVGRDEERGRIRERHVVGEHAGVDVPVRREDRQVAHDVVDPPRDGADPRLGRQQPVGMPEEWGGARHGPMFAVRNRLWQTVARYCPRALPLAMDARIVGP